MSGVERLEKLCDLMAHEINKMRKSFADKRCEDWGHHAVEGTCVYCERESK